MAPQSEGRPKLALLYHYMHPDDVVSAVHFDGLAEGLDQHGWAVEALPCTRGCRDEGRVYPRHEVHNNITYRRIWRPRFKQASFLGRLLNAAWMILAWSRLALRPAARRPDVVVVGTDPVFAVLVALPLKLLAPKIKIAHWCFDLHPEAAVIEGRVTPQGWPVRGVKRLMKAAYRRCDLIADLGPCMRRLLRRYDHNRRPEVELTPWALEEPPAPLDVDPRVRAELFGTAQLGLLYSGNFGEAHSFDEVLALARHLRGDPRIAFCFAVRGNRAEALRAAVTAEDTNIRFAGFAAREDLEKRLGAADIHIATLKAGWSGVAVPSKFFGSLAAGRPVLFAGPVDSAIGAWIARHGVGWTLATETVPQIAKGLEDLITDPAALHKMQARCHQVYDTQFSQAAVVARWNAALRQLLAGAP